MKFVYTHNPLYIQVELDEQDNEILRLKIKVDKLINYITGADFVLDSKSRNWLYKTKGKPISLKEVINRARKELDCAYIEGEVTHDDKSFEDEINEDLHWCLDALTKSHCGDCTCVPASCMKCRTEDLLGIATISDMSKHMGSAIWGVFGGAIGGEPSNTINDAIERLKDNTFQKSPHFDNYSDEDWNQLCARWTEDRNKAKEWLIQYKKDKLGL